ncbi:hypothetical protein [Sphingomonas sp. UYP23]
MQFAPAEQFVLLAVGLFAGWLLGLASAPRDARWKRRARGQAARFASYHRDVEDRLRAAQQRASDLNDALTVLHADHADAERTIARLRADAAASGAGVAAAATAESLATPSPATPAPPAPALPSPAPNGRPRDDLKRISGIDAMLAMRLFSLGLVRFEDIESLSAQDELALEPRLDLPAGYIARNRWRSEVASLRSAPADADTEGLMG